ncbi:uncharacterized protein [Branchiostoma lanceolatum]|uniref:uncharacterized protein n=1 Tax=Branchiostoma lanceolatum TaxID=7740 RepID=UPI0034550FCA
MAAQVDVEDYFEKVIAKVSYKWDDLARRLGLKRGEIKAIEATPALRDPKKRCREVLERWREGKDSEATLQVLQQALIEMGERRTAESLVDTAAPPSASGGNDSHQIGSSTDVPSSRQGAAAPPMGSGGHDRHPKAQPSQKTVTCPPVGGAGVPISHQGSGSRPVVLMLNDEYGTSKGGISTIHRQMGRLLVIHGAQVYSTVLQATQKDKEDAAADGVELIFPNTYEGDDRKPILNWLTWDHLTRYPNLPQNIDFIVGHVNITSRAARMIKKERLSDAKLVQVTHVIPEDVARYKSEEKELGIGDERDSILADLQDADVIVSVGPLLYDYYKQDTRRDEKDGHLEFLPEPSDIFKNTSRKYVNTKRKVVFSSGRVKGVEMLKGYDLLAKAMGKVMEHLPDTTLRIRGITPEDFSDSKAIINANKGRFDFVHFTPLKYGSQEELSKDMETADVVLMPSRAEPFGLVGLEAIAAGVPVLVSHKSGLARFLQTQGYEFDRMIVEIEDDDDAAAQTLAKRIIQILKDPEGREFKAAQSLKKKLLDSNYWAASHSKFLEMFRL